MASQPTAVSTSDLLGFLPAGVAVVALIASLQSPEIWAAALVAIAAVWAVDVSNAFEARGRVFAPLAVILTATAGAVVSHAQGPSGYALTLALSILICLAWPVFADIYRQVETFAPIALTGLLAGLAVASLVLASSPSSPAERAVDIFLVAVIAGVLLGALVARMPAVPFLDPFTTTALVTVIAAVIAAAVWDADVVGFLLVGLGLAVALIGGNGLSSMLRLGQVRLTARSPGWLPSLDAVVVAAAIYYPLLQAVL